MANEIANEIVSRLWLGNKQAAADDAWLKQHNVTAVFNCTKTLPFSESVHRLYRVPVDDNLEPEEIANMAAWAAETQVKLVREYKAGRTILVHCHAGMQRSAAVVAMFLITTTGMSADEAIAFVKSKRPIAFFPAVNFERAIRQWDVEFRKYRGSQQNGHAKTAAPSAIANTAN